MSTAWRKASSDGVLESNKQQGTSMAYIDIVTALALLQFVVFGFKVGGARAKYGVKAPAIAGNEIFERYFRVQQNTLEQLIVFVPGLYLFSRYFNPLWAAGLGVVYLIGRQVYAASYVKDPAKRGPGFGLTFLPAVILMLGGLIGAVLHLAGVAVGH
jgi:glutathione S-transferase